MRDVIDVMREVEISTTNYLLKINDIIDKVVGFKAIDNEIVISSLVDFCYNTLVSNDETLSLESVNLIDFTSVIKKHGISGDLFKQILESYMYGDFFNADLELVLMNSEMTNNWIYGTRDCSNIANDIISSDTISGEDVLHFIDDTESRLLVERIVSSGLDILREYLTDKDLENRHIFPIGWTGDRMVLVLSKVVNFKDTYVTI